MVSGFLSTWTLTAWAPSTRKWLEAPESLKALLVCVGGGGFVCGLSACATKCCVSFLYAYVRAAKQLGDAKVGVGIVGEIYLYVQHPFLSGLFWRGVDGHDGAEQAALGANVPQRLVLRYILPHASDLVVALAVCRTWRLCTKLGCHIHRRSSSCDYCTTTCWD